MRKTDDPSPGVPLLRILQGQGSDQYFEKNQEKEIIIIGGY
jgi:putative component of toxin-antitoxin plasmid stabilization module